MIETIRLIGAALCFLLGTATVVLSVLGVFKFRFIMNRMHSAALLDSLGLGLILIGLILISGTFRMIPKLLLVLLVQWIGSPIAAHMVGRMEINTNDNLSEHMDIENHSYEEEP